MKTLTQFSESQSFNEAGTMQKPVDKLKVIPAKLKARADIMKKVAKLEKLGKITNLWSLMHILDDEDVSPFADGVHWNDHITYTINGDFIKPGPKREAREKKIYDAIMAIARKYGEDITSEINIRKEINSYIEDINYWIQNSRKNAKYKSDKDTIENIGRVAIIKKALSELDIEDLNVEQYRDLYKYTKIEFPIEVGEASARLNTFSMDTIYTRNYTAELTLAGVKKIISASSKH